MSKSPAMTHKATSKAPKAPEAPEAPKRPERAAYDGAGLVAVHPSALGLEFALLDEPSLVEPYESRDGVAVVHCEGPLESGRYAWFDSYEAIVDRVRAALASNDTAAVVLSIDSPGGAVAGMLDASRALTEAAAAAGKPLIAHVGGQARSAAYALACGCTAIVASESALIGNVGVLYTRLDVTQADAEYGVRHHVIASGEHKADENPHTVFSESAAGELQAAVNTLAGMYAALVADRRPGAPASAELLVGRSYIAGADGVRLGLCDAVMSLDSLCAALAQDPSGGAILSAQGQPSDPEPDPMPMNEEARKAIIAAVTNALNAALSEGEEDKPEEGKAEGEEDSPKDDAKSKAEGDEDKPDAKGKAQDEGDDDEPEAAAGCEPPKAQAAPSDAALTALSAESAKRAQAEARAEAAERDALFASRTDLSDALRASLSKVPIAEARAIVGAIKPPEAAAAPADPRAAYAPKPGAPTEGKGNSDTGVTHLSAHAEELDRRFGLAAKAEPGVSYDPATATQSFGAMRPKH